MFNLSAYFADLTVPVPAEWSFFMQKTGGFAAGHSFYILIFVLWFSVFFSVLIAVIGLGVKGGDITLIVIFDLYL